VAADAPVNLQPGLLLLAAQSGFPIIPVATNAGQFWGRRSFLKRPGIIRLVIGPPIPVTGDRRAMLGTLTRALHMPPSA
jgi:1-acyl-sn-glycerol-3-phosphate acyltransferase